MGEADRAAELRLSLAAQTGVHAARVTTLAKSHNTPNMLVMPSDVRDNTALSRFELDAEGDTAVAYYSLHDGVMTFTHTEVAPAMRGQGIASKLIQGAFEIVRARGIKIVPRCTFVSAYLSRHPADNDLLA